MNRYDTQLREEEWKNISAYKNDFHATVRLNVLDLKDAKDDVLEVCGRVLRKRRFAGVVFADIFESGCTVQITCMKSKDPAAYKYVSRYINAGDYIGVCGRAGLTKSGNETIYASEVSLLTRAMNPLPDKYLGVQNSQTLKQARYLDIIGDEEEYKIYIRRSRIIQLFREYLLDRGFIEMDTPVLSTFPSGSNARQFEAHHIALGCPVYMQVTAELNLKQMVLCGYDKVFEFCRCFRNEGGDRLHRQEFLNLEIYSAYMTVEELKKLVQEMYITAFLEFFPQQGLPEIPTVDVHNALLNEFGIDICSCTELSEMKTEMLKRNIITEGELPAITNINAYINRMLRQVVKQEGFYYLKSYPAKLHPLSRVRSDDERFADMEYLYYKNFNIAQFCGEETDPVRLEDGLKYQSEIGWKKQLPDREFIRAVRTGLPPMCGVGISMERMIMILCGKDSMYETNFFHLFKA